MLRIIPRIIIGGYTFLLYNTYLWFTLHPNLTMAQAGVVATIFGITAPVSKIYHSSSVKVDSQSKVSISFSEYITNISYCLDQLRIIPRFVLIGYSILLYNTYVWFSLQSTISTAQAAVIATIFGITAPVAAVYHNSGNMSNGDQ